MDKRTLFLLVTVGILVVSVIGIRFLPAPDPKTYPEVSELGMNPSWSFDELTSYFRELSEEKGALYAFDVLRYAELPPDTDIHLVAHVIGSMLYEQKGIKAIEDCTQDFRNACSHSVVIGILGDYGEGILGEIADTCKKAPGGDGAYGLCFHGLGHGVLAYTGYDMEKAIDMCRRVGTAEYNNWEYIECVGGAVMEMTVGAHDPLAWQQQVRKYFKKDDPLSPCNADYMPEEARPICYTYLTPRLYLAVGIDLHAIDPAKYVDAFALCKPLPEGSEARASCYGGFGKEFAASANERDIRSVGLMQEPALRDVRSWCALAGDAEGEKNCNRHALASLFWGGEAVPDASFTFCAIAPSKEAGDCYTELSKQISRYFSGRYQGRELCDRLPELYQASCRARTL